MKLSRFTMTTAALLCLGVALPSDEARSQEKVTKDKLVGTWASVSVVVERSDGTKFEPFGPNPKGMVIFAADGRYSFQLMRPDLPKIAANDRLKGTGDENEAIAKGVLSHFGTYSVNEAEGTYTLHVEASSYANYTGTDQKRIVTSLTADELKWTNPTPSTPTTAYTVFRRVK